MITMNERQKYNDEMAHYIFIIQILTLSEAIEICKIEFACNWAVSKKLATGFALILCCEIKIYLFGFHLLFKSL